MLMKSGKKEKELVLNRRPTKGAQKIISHTFLNREWTRWSIIELFNERIDDDSEP